MASGEFFDNIARAVARGITRRQALKLGAASAAAVAVETLVTMGPAFAACSPACAPTSTCLGSACCPNDRVCAGICCPPDHVCSGGGCVESAGRFVGEVRTFGFGVPPSGWAYCNGAARSTTTDAALFSVIGYTYGGSGSTFLLPDLRGAVPVDDGAAGFPLGASGGEAGHALTPAEMPQHDHAVRGSSDPATLNSPAGGYLASSAAKPYATNPAGATLVTLAPTTLAPQGGGQPHENRQPFLTVTPCIALTGDVPS